MTEPTEKLKGGLETITLSPVEHAAIRNKLTAFMRASPERHVVHAFVFRHATAFAVAVVALLAGATTLQARQSLPGDLLYPVRLAVTDRFSVAVAGDEDARMDRELEQMERIMDEEAMVASEELAALALDNEADVTAAENGDDYDADLEAEFRALERLLEQEESSAELELSL